MTDKQTVKFGDICKEVKLSTKDPVGEGYERYVGLEHLDSESLKISRWGMIAEDNPSFTRVFKKGQILVGKRRPYLKKAAIAEFDGICSGDIIVIEPSGALLSPKLLPYLIHSESFWGWAVKTSSGSLSPRTKFSALKQFEFTCPDDNKQRKMTQLVDKTELLVKKYDEALAAGEYVISNVLAYRRLDGWKEEPLKDLLDICIDYRGKSPPKSKEGLPLITAKNIRAGFLDPEPREYIPECEYSNWMTRGLPKNGDVLFTTEAPLGNIAFAPSYKFALGQRTVCFRAKASKLSSEVLFWVLQTEYFRHALKSRMTGTTAQGIKVRELLKLNVLYPQGDSAKTFEITLSACSKTLKKIQYTKSKLPSVSTMFR